MVDQQATPKPKKNVLPPLPPVRRRWMIPWTEIIIVAILVGVLGFPTYYFGRAIIASAHIKEGSLALERQQYDLARDKYFAAMGLTGENEDPYQQRLQIARETGNFQFAITDYSAIIRDHPDRYLPYCYRAETFRALEEDSKALADYRACLEHKPDRIWESGAENSIRVLERRGVK